MSGFIKNIILGNRYFDSLKLMRVSGKAGDLEGVDKVSVVMATELNKQILREVGLATAELDEAKAEQLVVALSLKDERSLDRVLCFINCELDRAAAPSGKSGQAVCRTLETALSMLPGANLALISVPGRYAKREARKALESGLHVLLFSDNVSVEEELELKQLARSRNLLVMGPGCGTAIISGVPLAFANVMKKGPVGIVAASGTGIQEVSCLVSNAGVGVSHAIGTGGRDLSDQIGGITMMQGIEMLEKDPQTEVIVLVSKPPGARTAKKLAEFIGRCKKPFVVNFIGSSTSSEVGEVKWKSASTLEDTAGLAIALARGEEYTKRNFTDGADRILFLAKQEWKGFKEEQQFVRGLYSGGTVCSEAALILSDLVSPLSSNIPPKPELRMANTKRSEGHVCLDMGDEEFTVGRAHPMIDPTLRKNRIIQEAQDPATAVLLLDVELGYGSHADPAGALVQSIREAKDIASGRGGYLSVVAFLIGAYEDPQGYDAQKQKLVDVGVLVLPSNAQAVRMASLIATRGTLSGTFFKGV